MNPLYCRNCHQPLTQADPFCRHCGVSQQGDGHVLLPPPTAGRPIIPPLPEATPFQPVVTPQATASPTKKYNIVRTVVVILIVCLFRAYGGRLGNLHAPLPLPPGATNLLEARAGFSTRNIPNRYRPDGDTQIPPTEIFQTIHYPSPVGPLLAYVSPDPGDGKRHPALIWAHGGFGGIGDFLWKKDDQQDPGKFREAGLIVMCSSWRAENDNPGQFQLFYGEVEDAVAAVDYVARLPYVDPNRIYFAGHSTGGTMTLLTVESTRKLRAAFSFGGCPNMLHLMTSSGGAAYNNTPFDWHDERESQWRSPMNFVSYIHTPTFYFEGASSFYPEDARQMEERARTVGAPFSAYIVNGGDHFTILQPETALVTQKILADTDPTCNIQFTQEEVNRAFSSR